MKGNKMVCHTPGYKMTVQPVGWWSKLLWKLITIMFVVRSDDSMKVTKKE